MTPWTLLPGNFSAGRHRHPSRFIDSPRAIEPVLVLAKVAGSINLESVAPYSCVLPSGSRIRSDRSRKNFSPTGASAIKHLRPRSPERLGLARKKAQLQMGR